MFSEGGARYCEVNRVLLIWFSRRTFGSPMMALAIDAAAATPSRIGAAGPDTPASISAPAATPARSPTPEVTFCAPPRAIEEIPWYVPAPRATTEAICVVVPIALQPAPEALEAVPAGVDTPSAAATPGSMPP